jgi:hypothetical protein
VVWRRPVPQDGKVIRRQDLTIAILFASVACEPQSKLRI